MFISFWRKCMTWGNKWNFIIFWQVQWWRWTISVWRWAGITGWNRNGDAGEFWGAWWNCRWLCMEISSGPLNLWKQHYFWSSLSVKIQFVLLLKSLKDRKNDLLKKRGLIKSQKPIWHLVYKPALLIIRTLCLDQCFGLNANCC